MIRLERMMTIVMRMMSINGDDIDSYGDDDDYQ